MTVRAVEGGRRAAAPNLEEVTLKDIGLSEGRCPWGGVQARVVVYSDGSRVTLSRRRKGRVSPRTSGRTIGDASCLGAGVGSLWCGLASGVDALTEGERFPYQRCFASLLRSKSLVRHRARCLLPKVMWTFTKRGKFESLSSLWTVWKKFSRTMRKRHGDDWRYVAVPELHSDGLTWHMHVLVDRVYLVESIRLHWYRALGGSGCETGAETLGQVNAKWLRARCLTSRGAASYISKYLGKGFGEGSADRRIFAASVGLSPVAMRWWRCVHDIGFAPMAFAVGRGLRHHFGMEVVLPRWKVTEFLEICVIDAF